MSSQNSTESVKQSSYQQSQNKMIDTATGFYQYSMPFIPKYQQQQQNLSSSASTPTSLNINQ